MFKCDICQRTYQYKRNLTRHITEKHSKLKHWRCIEPDCEGKFIRRGYLLDHLTNIHKYPRSEARQATLRATREDIHHSSNYYEDVSSDEDIFDILAENEEMNAVQYDEVIQSFDIGMFENNDIDSFSNAMSDSKKQVDQPKDCNEETDINVNEECRFNVNQSDLGLIENVRENNVTDIDSSSTDEISIESNIRSTSVDYNDVSESETSGQFDQNNNVVYIIDDDDEDDDYEDYEVDDDGGNVNVVTSDSEEIERRTLRTVVEVWTRTGLCYTTYRGDSPIYKTSRYEDDYHCYEMKQ
jgi:hypothetical protein